MGKVLSWPQQIIALVIVIGVIFGAVKTWKWNIAREARQEVRAEQKEINDAFETNALTFLEARRACRALPGSVWVFSEGGGDCRSRDVAGGAPDDAGGHAGAD